MTNTKDIILQLRKVRKDEGLSYTDILERMKANGDSLSRSTLSNMFGKHWERYSFSYDFTIRPIAKALLGMESITKEDAEDIAGIKMILKYKLELIQNLEAKNKELKESVEREKAKTQRKLEEQAKFYEQQIAFLTDRVEFLLAQIARKDDFARQLADSNFQKDELLVQKDKQKDELMQRLFACQSCTVRKED